MSRHQTIRPTASAVRSTTMTQLLKRAQELLAQARESAQVPAARHDALDELDQVLDALGWACVGIEDSLERSIRELSGDLACVRGGEDKGGPIT